MAGLSFTEPCGYDSDGLHKCTHMQLDVTPFFNSGLPGLCIIQVATLDKTKIHSGQGAMCCKQKAGSQLLWAWLYVCVCVAGSVVAVPGSPRAVCLIDSVGLKCHSQQSLGSPRDRRKLQATIGEENDIGVPRKQPFTLLWQRRE